MVSPNPELQRKFRNTDAIVKSGRSYLVSEMVSKYPQDYIDLTTYKLIKKK